jgi:hypothetical protein
VASFTDLTLWTVVATWILALGTLFLMYWQTRLTQRLNSANTVMMLRERFDSARLRIARRNLSQLLVENRLDDLTTLEVPAFFELVGAQTARGILDLEMVWEAFGSWVTSYYYALTVPTNQVETIRSRSHDPLVFGKFEWLYHRIVEIDRKKLGASYDASFQAIEAEKSFLLRESKLALTDE